MRKSELKEDNEYIDSQYKLKKACDMCSKTQKKIVLCQRCKRSLCQQCFQNGQSSYCLTCNDEMNFIAQQISKQKIKWCNQSMIGEQWAQSLLDKDFKMLDEEYKELIISINKNKESLKKSIPSFEKACQDIEILSLNGSGLNYSLKDFIMKTGYTNNNYNGQDDDINSVKNILFAFTFMRQEVGYISQMKNLAFFLLCFMKESLAYFCFLKLITEILSEKMWPNNINTEILNKQINNIVQISLKFNSLSNSESIRIKYSEFLAKNLQQYYSSFLIGVVSYKDTFNYFNNLIKEQNFYCVDEFIIIISLINYDAIVNEKMYLHQYILFNTSFKKINQYSLQLNEFLDNVTSVNEIQCRYKENQKLQMKKEKLVQLLQQLQIEQQCKQSQQNMIESEIDMTKFVTEIGINSVQQEEKKLQNNVIQLQKQLNELKNEENNLKESITNNNDQIQKLMEMKSKQDEQIKKKTENKDLIEMKYLNRKHQLQIKIQNLQNDLNQYDNDIAVRTKILQARKKQLLNFNSTTNPISPKTYS